MTCLILILLLSANCLKPAAIEKPKSTAPAKENTVKFLDGIYDSAEKYFSLIDFKNVNAKDEEGCTALHKAVLLRKITLVQFCLEKGANPCIKDSEGQLPIHIAAFMGDLEVVKLLLEKECYSQINVRDDKGKTPLHYATLGNSPEVVKCLLDKEANLYIKDNDGKLPLHLAASKANLEVVKLLLEKKRSTQVYPDGEGKIPLQLSCNKEIRKYLKDKFKQYRAAYVKGLFLAVKQSNKQEKIKEYLKREKIPVDIKNEKGDGLLHTVISKMQEDYPDLMSGKVTYEQIENIKDNFYFLIKRGADISIQNSEGKTLLHLLASSSDETMFEYIYREIFIYLLEKNILTNSKDNHNSTPLHCAVSANNIKAVQLLLAHKDILIEEKDGENKTAWEIAVEKNFKEVADTIEKARTKQFNEILDALKKNDIDKMTDFLEKNASIINMKSNDDNGWLHLAITFNCFIDMIELLIEKGASTKTRNNNGQTPLQLAVSNGLFKIAQCFLKHENFEVNEKDEEGKTLLHYAVLSGNLKMVELLLGHKDIKIDEKDKNSKTALELAKEKNLKKIFNVLAKAHKKEMKKELFKILSTEKQKDPEISEEQKKILAESPEIIRETLEKGQFVFTGTSEKNKKHSSFVIKKEEVRKQSLESLSIEKQKKPKKSEEEKRILRERAKNILKENPEFVDKRLKDGQSIFIKALLEKEKELATFLIDNFDCIKKEIMSQEFLGLFQAIDSNDLEAVKILLNARSSLRSIMRHQRNFYFPLEFAKKCEHMNKSHAKEITHLITQRQEELDSTLIKFVQNPSTPIEEIEDLIRMGASPQAEDWWGCKAVSLAGSKALKACIEQACLECNADLVRKISEGNNSPLLSEHIQSHLLRGASAEGFSSESFFSPTYLAAQGEKSDLLNLLIESGADIDEERNGHTSLEHALTYSQKEAICLLLKQGANPFKAKAWHKAFTCKDKIIKNMMLKAIILKAASNTLKGIGALCAAGCGVCLWHESKNTGESTTPEKKVVPLRKKIVAYLKNLKTKKKSLSMAASAALLYFGGPFWIKMLREGIYSK